MFEESFLYMVTVCVVKAYIMGLQSFYGIRPCRLLWAGLRVTHGQMQ